ncbi:MAG: hypothetical protein KDA68_20370 [Planctomycetaceae bacterium]|nr:hypothetical protein [Planctomycetaceae bacterium]
MTSVLDSPSMPSSSGTQDSSHELRQATAAVRLSFTSFGVRKALTPAQKAQAAEPFGAQEKFLSAGKKLLDTQHPAFRGVTQVRGQIGQYWKAHSLPYPESGIRLIRRDFVDTFSHRLEEFREELREAVITLDQQYEELRTLAQRRLGSLFDLGDYPSSLQGWFDVEWEFPSVEPPDYLRRLNPELFRQEQQRISSRFEEAVQLAEQVFVGELQQLIGHLSERLSGRKDGKPKIFRDSAVTHLRDFFERFRSLSIGSQAEFEALVQQTESLLQGVEPVQLRNDEQLRQRLQRQLGSVETELTAFLIDRPRRKLVRPTGGEAAT